MTQAIFVSTVDLSLFDLGITRMVYMAFTSLSCVIRACDKRCSVPSSTTFFRRFVGDCPPLCRRFLDWPTDYLFVSAARHLSNYSGRRRVAAACA